MPSGYADRQTIIDILKQQGAAGTEINDALVRAGYEPLTTEERKDLPTLGQGGLGQTLLKGAVRNVDEIKAGVPTFMGGLARLFGEAALAGREEQSPSKEAKRTAREFKTLQYLRPLMTPRNLIDIPLGQYNITSERILNSLGVPDRSGKTLSLDDVLYGMANNPLFATADLAAPGSSVMKGLGKVTGLSKKISSIKEMNKLLNNARLMGQVPNLAQSQELERIATRYRALSKEEREAISRAVQKTGETDLGNKLVNKVLEGVKKSSKESTDLMVKNKLIQGKLNMDNVIANYIGNNLGWKGVDHAKIMKQISDPSKIKDPRILDLYNQGLAHYNAGNIAFITQKVNPSQLNPLGTLVEKAPNYYEQPRYIGTRTPEEMADYIPMALQAQADYASGMVGLKNLVKQLEHYQSPSAGGKDTIYLSTKGLKDMPKRASEEGFGISEALRSIPQATEEEIAKGNAIALSPTEYKMLNKYGTGTKIGRVLSTWKRSVLGGLKWLVENRLGALQGNLIEGVGPNEFIKAFADYKNAPEQLNALTKAYGYAQDVPLGGNLGVKDAIERMGLGVRGLAKNLQDLDIPRAARSAAEVPLGLADLAGKPAFNIESYFDKLERYANLKKQAQRAAKKMSTGTKKVTAQEVEDMAKADPQLFADLYEGVNKSLGDYYGRNYVYPSLFEDIRQEVIPFSKFFTNTARVTANQLANHPLRSQMFLTGPTKLGRDVWYDIQDQGIVQDPEKKGGFPTGDIDPNTNVARVVRSEGMPISALANIAGGLTDMSQEGPEELTAITSPILGLKDMLRLKSNFGNKITSPKYVEDPKDKVLYKRGEDGELVPEKYKPNVADYAGAVGTQLAKQFYGPAVHERDYRLAVGGAISPIKRAVTENIPLSQAMQEARVYPMYDTSLNPLEEGNISATPARGPMDILGRLIGFRIYSPYVNPKEDVINKASYKRAVRRSMRKE